MNKQRICIFILFWLFMHLAYSQRNIIIETDGATDDFRAICAFLSVKEIHILGISTVQGALAPDSCIVKLKQLLSENKKDNIALGLGVKHKSEPEFGASMLKMEWGKTNANNLPVVNYIDFYKNILEKAPLPVDIIGLGPLTHIFQILKNPELKKKIKRIIWYNSYGTPMKGFNYAFDSIAAKGVLAMDVPIDIISNLNYPTMLFDDKEFKKIDQENSTLGKRFVVGHQLPVIQKMIKEKHIKYWDELIPVYYLYPQLFDQKIILKNPNIKFTIAFDSMEVKNKFISLINQNYNLEKNVSFEVFPTNPLNYQSDMRPWVNEILQKYGLAEFKAVILCNEIHGHLGVYSIIGAKMGILAREKFGVDLDRLKVLSHASSKPPLSCINDGIQCSTGATMGLGLFEVASLKNHPEAIFEYQSKKLLIRLKPQYSKEVDSELEKFILQFGGLTDGYWKIVRKQALEVWRKWDRSEIFETIEIKDSE